MGRAASRQLEYDFSAFDERVLRQQRIKRQKERKKEEAQAKRKQDKAAFTPAAFVLFFVICAMFALVVMNYVQLSELSAQEIKLRNELARLEDENKHLNIKLEEKLDLRNIEQYAQTKLGMVKLEKYQIEYVSLSGDQRVEVVDNNKAQNSISYFLSGIVSSLNVILGYLS